MDCNTYQQLKQYSIQQEAESSICSQIIQASPRQGVANSIDCNMKSASNDMDRKVDHLATLVEQLLKDAQDAIDAIDQQQQTEVTFIQYPMHEKDLSGYIMDMIETWMCLVVMVVTTLYCLMLSAIEGYLDE